MSLPAYAPWLDVEEAPAKPADGPLDETPAERTERLLTAAYDHWAALQEDWNRD